MLQAGHWCQYILKLPNTATIHNISQIKLQKQIHHLLDGMCIMQNPICWKSSTIFNIRLKNHRKHVSNSKSIPNDLHFRKPKHSFNLHAKFTLIKQLSNIHTTDKEMLKFWLKHHEDFWIQKLETVTSKGLNQELNNV